MDYKEVNRKLWNDKVDAHVASEFYDVEAFIQGKNVLNSIELDLLGNIAGKSILHLQCHFGQDSIELSRMGAQVTGVDLSDKAIEKAKWLAERCGTQTRFVCCDVYDAPSHVAEKFDIVFTSYGTVGWLPDMGKWAKVITHFLKPGGKFVFAEFHPVVWMFDNSFTEIKYGYFNSGMIVEEMEGTYADRNAPIKNKEISWNHTISEVMDALIQNGLQIETIQEFDYSPYDCFQNTVKRGERMFQIKGLEGKMPMVYALRAVSS
ncbi:MAG: class I SAM-dependent methyltransferase [Flavobacteriales bacterium]